MSSEVDEKAAELLSLAIKHNRQEYIEALSFLVPIVDLAKTLADKPESFNDSWKKKLLRNEYSIADIDQLTQPQLLKNTEYLDFVVQMAASVNNDNSRIQFVGDLMAQGKYQHALKCYQLIDDKDLMETWMKAKINRFSRVNSMTYFYKTGEPELFSRDAAVLFDAMNLEVPATFDGVYGERAFKTRWSDSRFDAAVDWVSEISQKECLGSPTLVQCKDGTLAIENATVLKAFIAERTRIETQHSAESWHGKYFPRFAPVLATPELATVLQSQGAILVEPEFGQFHTDGRYDINEASHAFISMNDSTMDKNEISMSMALLPYDVITEIRNAPDTKKVLLIPHDSSLTLLPSATVSEDLRIAMKFHRPELMKNRHRTSVDGLRASQVDTRAYLRGVDIKYDHNTDLIITNQLIDDPRFLRAMTSPVELEYLRKYYTPSRYSASNRVRLEQKVNGGPIEEQIDMLLSNLGILIENLGYTPGLTFAGSEEFVRAFLNRDLPVTECNKCLFWEADQTGKFSGRDTDAQTRLSAQLGEIGEKFEDLPPEELLTKAVRNKGRDKLFHNRACGVLDRLGVVEVAALARTPAQRAFVIDNFDVKSYLKQMPTAIRRVISGPLLDDAMGL